MQEDQSKYGQCVSDVSVSSFVPPCENRVPWPHRQAITKQLWTSENQKTTAATYDSPAMNSGPLACSEAVLLALPLIWSHLPHSSVFSWQSFSYSSVGQFPSRGHFSWLQECRSKKEDMEKKSNRAAPFFCRASDSSFSSSSPSSSSPNGSVEMKQPRLLDF